MAGTNVFHIGSDFDEKGITQLKKAKKVALAEAKKPIVQRFVGEVDESGWQEFAALNKEAEGKAQADAITQPLGFKITDEATVKRYQQMVNELDREAARHKAATALGFDPAVLRKVERSMESAHVAALKMNRDLDTTNNKLRSTGRAAAGAAGGFGGLSKAFKGMRIPLLSFNTRVPVLKLALIGKLAYDAAGGIIALTSAIAPMTGVLAAIGPLATSAAQGIGAIKLATSGIGDAVSAAFAEQDKAATASASSLVAQASAAEAVREAQLSLSNAQRGATDAQEQLTVARKDATREVEDMRRAVRDLALQEEGASLSLKEAKAAFAELAKTGAGELEIEQASLRIREAREELRKTREESRRTRQDLGAVEAGGGVKGMPEVVAARRGLEDANRGVVEAEREVANAIKQSATAMEATSGAADTLAAKMNALSPPARRFAEFIIGLRPQLKRLQGIAAQGLLPGVEKGITSAMKQLPRFQRIIAGTSEVLGDLAEKAGRRLGSEAFGKDIETQGKRNEVTIRRLGEAGLDLVGAFRHITLAAGPMVDRLTKWVGTLTDAFRRSVETGRETGKLQKFFKDAGDTFFKVGRIIADLAVSLFQIGRASREAFGNELLNNIERGAQNLKEWTKSVEGQKELRSVFEDIGNNLRDTGRAIQNISEDFRRMKAEGKTSGEALSHIFIDLFTNLVANGAEFGAKMALAFFKGFIKADIWGKIVAGAFLLSRLSPLIQLFRKQGVVAGAAMGEGAAEGMAATAGGGGFIGGLRQSFGRLSPRVRAIGKGVIGAALVTGIGAAMSDRASFGPTNIFQKFQQGVSSLTLGLVPGLKSLDERFQTIIKRIGEFKGQLSLDEVTKDWGDFNEEQQKVIKSLVSVHNATEEFKDKFGLQLDADTPLKDIRRLETGFDRLRLHITGSLKDTLRQVNRNTNQIARSLGSNTREGVDAARKNFRLGMADIRDLVRSGVVAADEGAKAIRKVMVHYLATFGIKGKVAKVLAGTYSPKEISRALSGDTRLPSARGGSDTRAHGKQRGGPINMGKASGDSVPAMLERGEYVLNRKAVQKVGKDQLDRVNFGDAPRFQKGGIVDMLAAARKLDRAQFPYVWGGGHQATPAPFGPMDCSGAVSFVLQHGGVQIPTMVSGALASAGRPGPGQVTVFANPTHTFMRIGNHYFGTSASNPDGGAGFFPDPGEAYKSGFVQRHFLGGEGAFGDAPTLPQLEVSGPGGSVQVLAQRALDTVRAGAQLVLNKAAETVGAPIGRGDPGDPEAGAYSKGQLKELWVRAGGPPGVANLAAAVALAESGGRPGASNQNTNGSVDRGLWQINDIHGDLSTFDPMGNARAAVKISSSGTNWNPWTVFQTGAYRKFLQKGGPVGPLEMAAGGTPFGKNDPKKLPKLTGTLTQKTRKTAKALAASKDKKRRAKILARFKNKLKKYGLPSKLINEIGFLGLAHDRYSDFANSALEGDVTNDDDTVTKGLIQGKNEGDWLALDLQTMFSMRNKLIKAKNIVTGNEKQVSKTFKWVDALLDGYRKGAHTPRGWDGINPATDSVEKWNKQAQPKRNQLRKKWKDRHGRLPGTREWNDHTGKVTQVPKSKVNAYKTLKDKLGNQRVELQGAIADSATNPESIPAQLETLQGFGPPQILKSPWPRGTIYGGDILSTQDRILELFKIPPATTDDTADASESTELLQQLLREANLRTAVAERQFDILRNFPPFGGQFATGGTVPGPTGAPRTVIAHGGETITPAGRGTAAPNVYVNIDGKVSWLKDFVTTQVQAETRQMAKGRALPGRGGGR